MSDNYVEEICKTSRMTLEEITTRHKSTLKLLNIIGEQAIEIERLKLQIKVGIVEIGDLIYEDDLPEMTDQEYAEWFKASVVIDGVRMGNDPAKKIAIPDGMPAELHICRWSDKVSDCHPPEECSRNKKGYCEIDEYKCDCICYKPQ
jgi:hypothetical protein